MPGSKFRFAIDRGGTFTDVWASLPDGRSRVMKLLSEDPANYADAPREGIRRILQQVRYCKVPVIKVPVAVIQKQKKVKQRRDTMEPRRCHAENNY